MPRKRVRSGIDQTRTSATLTIASPRAAGAGRPCRWRASAARRGPRARAAPTSADVPQPPSRGPPRAPGARRRRRPRAGPTPRPARRPPRPRVTAGCSRSRAATAAGGHVHAAADDDVVEPAEHVQPAVVVEPPRVGGQEPAVDQHLGGQRRVAVVPVEQGRPGDPDPAVGADRHGHAVEREPVVDAAAGGLGRAVGRHHADAGRHAPAGAAPGRPGRRRPARRRQAASAAVSSGVVERRGGAGSRPGRCTAPRRLPRRRRPATRGRRAAPAGAPPPATGRPPAARRRTTSGSASTHGPAPPSRDSVAPDRREHRAPREHHALGPPGRAGRLDDDRLRLGRSGQPGVDLGRPSGQKSTRRTLLTLGRIPAMPTWIERFLPPEPRSRAGSSFQSILFAIGEGAFLTGSAVFFTHIVGLSAAQVGLGLTIAGLVVVRVRGAAGTFADRVGTEAAVGDHVVHRRRLVPRLALARGLRAVRGHGGGARGGRHGRLHGVRGATPSTSSPARSGCAPRRSCAAPSTSASRSAP